MQRILSFYYDICSRRVTFIVINAQNMGHITSLFSINLYSFSVSELTPVKNTFCKSLHLKINHLLVITCF